VSEANKSLFMHLLIATHTHTHTHTHTFAVAQWGIFEKDLALFVESTETMDSVGLDQRALRKLSGGVKGKRSYGE
jgi:hypothetical protein